MRKVVDKDMVAHLWANQSQDEARNQGGNFYFRGDTIYSYGSHFRIAKFAWHKDKKCILLNSNSYSVTTSAQQHIVRMAIRNT